MKFLTNIHQSEAKEFIDKLCRDENRNLVFGIAKSTKMLSLSEIISEGMIGIYEAEQTST